MACLKVASLAAERQHRSAQNLPLSCMPVTCPTWHSSLKNWNCCSAVFSGPSHWPRAKACPHDQPGSLTGSPGRADIMAACARWCGLACGWRCAHACASSQQHTSSVLAKLAFKCL